MGSQHTPADDIVYDLVSVQYHALKAAQAYDGYARDAEGHENVRAFFEECAEQDARRAQRCHELLKELTADTGLSGT
jgi:hypothetical protein